MQGSEWVFQIYWNKKNAIVIKKYCTVRVYSVHCKKNSVETEHTFNVFYFFIVQHIYVQYVEQYATPGCKLENISFIDREKSVTADSSWILV